MAKRTCGVDGCEREVGPKSARGMCNRHYKRFLAHGDPTHPVYKVPPAEVRFRQKYRQGASDECWEWQGSRHPQGHGTFNAGVNSGGYTFAHRFSWELANGPIPEGLVIRHRCDNPPCVNPAHLDVGTQGDNGRDMVERGRDAWSTGVRKKRTGCTVEGCTGKHHALGMCRRHYGRHWHANNPS